MSQKRYEGFLKTPCLWKHDVVFSLNQFEIESRSETMDLHIDENLRLGKYVERLVSCELEKQYDISVLAENIQIQAGNITLGELDCLILKKNKPIHLEIIYKFYLYDSSVGTTEIEHFIGPNRKDSLLEKLTKLKQKQLPLLYNDACKPYLEALHIQAEHVTQQVYFKAQLFLPFSNENISLHILNTRCIAGFYIHRNELNQFKDCKFYIPIKKDWLLQPHTNVNWMNLNAFEAATNHFFEKKFSALCWIKFSNGTLKKLFLVWW